MTDDERSTIEGLYPADIRSRSTSCNKRRNNGPRREAPEWRHLYGRYRKIKSMSADHLPEIASFKFVCAACGSLAIKIADLECAPVTTVVECARCGSPRGTLAALQDLARRGKRQLYEF
jgi:hypothetical protein